MRGLLYSVSPSLVSGETVLDAVEGLLDVEVVLACIVPHDEVDEEVEGEPDEKVLHTSLEFSV